MSFLKSKTLCKLSVKNINDNLRMYYAPGDDFFVWNTDISKLGIMVCFDAQFPKSARLLALKGAEINMVPTGGIILLTIFV